MKIFKKKHFILISSSLMLPRHFNTFKQKCTFSVCGLIIIKLSEIIDYNQAPQ